MVNRKRRRPTANDAVLPQPPPPITTSDIESGATVGSNRNDRTEVTANGSANNNINRNDLLNAATQSQARPARPNTYTNSGVAGVLYAELITWAIREVAVRYRHRTSVTRARSKLIPPIDTSNNNSNLNSNNSNSNNSNNSPTSTTTLPHQLQLQLHYHDKNINATCTNCASAVSASRYAQHLEKCLGKGGRSSSRAASARLKASAEREEREDSEAPAVPVSHGRRRRAATADADLRTGNTKRHRRSSPAPTPVARNIPARNR